MTVIDSYLDTLFAPYPESPRLREARRELRSMMEDKQQALLDEGLSESQAVGRVIAEFGSLEEVAPVLGIDRDLGSSAPQPAEPHHPPLDEDRLEAYIQRVRGTQWMPALAIPTFVLAPAPLLVLLAATGDVAPATWPTWAMATGIVTLLVMIALGVVTLLIRSTRLEAFEDVERGRFHSTPALTRRSEQIYDDHRPAAARATAVAVVLWILSGIPLILTGFLSPSTNDHLPLYGACGTLALVALGLLLHIRHGWVEHVTSSLDQEEDEDDEDMLENSSSPVIRVIASVYWPVVLMIYLGWSLGAGAWHISWIVWVLAGILYSALWSIDGALRSPSREHRAS